MKFKPLTHLPSVMTAIAGIAFISTPVLSQVERNNGISVTMSPAASNLTQGEPVVINYTITNFTQEDAVVDIRDGINDWREDDGRGWVTFMLKDAQGNVAPAVSHAPVRYRGAFSKGPRVPAGSSYNGSLVATQWFSVPHPGDYNLAVHLQLICTLGSGRSLSLAPVVQDFSFPLTVTTVSPGKLASVANSLSQAYLTAKAGAPRLVLLRELLSLPQASALPTWQALLAEIQTKSGYAAEVAEELSHIDEPSAVDLLEQMSWPANTQESQEMVQSAQSALAWIGRSGSPGIKQHVTELFTNHGVAAPADGPLRLD